MNQFNDKFKFIISVYLKLYQLRKPVIQDYDCILIDEAQDLTPGKIRRNKWWSMFLLVIFSFV